MIIDALVPEVLVGAAAVGTAVVIISFDRRLMLLGLALQYAAAVWFTWDIINMEAALAKLAVGLAVIAGLAVTINAAGWGRHTPQYSALPTGLAFRTILGVFGILSGFGLAARGWLPVPGLAGPAAAVVGVLMVGGLIQAGLIQTGSAAIVGLLMALTGFELALSHVEQSLAVAALLGLTHVGLGVAAGYLELHQVEPVPHSGSAT